MDNTALPTGGGGDTIRTLDRTGLGLPKTEVVQLDAAGPSSSAESLVSGGNPLPVQSAFDQLRVALSLQTAAYLAAQPQNGFTPLELPAFLAQLQNQTYTYDRTALEIQAGITPVNPQYPTNDVRRLGVVGNGVVDDTVALQNCFTVGGEWRIFPGAEILCTATITGKRATKLYSESPINPDEGSQEKWTQVFLRHNFNGTFFDLVGDAKDDRIGAGFAFENLCFLNTHGNGTGGSGTCIRSYATVVRCPWIKVRNCSIEQNAGNNCFTWGIDIDGTAVAIPNNNRDIFLENIRITSDAFVTGSIRVAGVANVFLGHCECNLANGILSVTGTDATHLCQSVFITGCTFAAVNLDWCSSIYGAGNVAATFTSTANTLDVGLELNLTSAPPTILGTRVTVYGENSTGKWCISTNNNTRFEMGANTAEFSGPVSSDTAVQAGTNPATTGAVRTPNGVGTGAVLSARNASNSGNIDMLGVDGSNRVQLAPAGAAILWGTTPAALGGGAVPTFGTIGGAGPAVAAQNEWLKVVDNNGNIRWIPVWA